MKSSITQIMKEMLEEMIKVISKKGILNIEQKICELMVPIKKGVLGLMAETIEEMDKGILKAKRERKKEGITVKQRNVPRMIYVFLKKTLLFLPFLLASLL